MMPGPAKKSDQPTREPECERPFSGLLAMRHPADAATRTDHRIGEVLRAFWKRYFACSPAIWTINRFWRLRWQQELKVRMELGPPKETHIPKTLLRYDLYVAGFIFVRNPYDLTIQAQSHEAGPIEEER